MESYWTALIWLLPLCAIVSWWLGRRSVKQHDSSPFGRVHPEYFKGLNYVLNEQPDKAIEVFIKMLDVDSETVETHLALGNLFRRRGEVDRAIRIHQNLIARPALSREERDIALLELGMDYMRSGLFDRAENLFKELVASGSHPVQAYRELLDIYQQEKDWNNAIVTARRLESAADERLNPVIANFYCELAEEMRDNGDEKSAKDNLVKALGIDPDCVRASMIEAELLQEHRQYKQALKVYKRIEKQGPDYLSEVIEPMHACYRKLDMLDEFIDYLHDIVARYGGINSIRVLAELIAERQGEEAAVGFMTAELKKRPTVAGVDNLIQYALTQAEGSTRDSLVSIKELTGRLLRSRTDYKCLQCGFDAKTLHWRCPGCKHWNTIKPLQGPADE